MAVVVVGALVSVLSVYLVCSLVVFFESSFLHRTAKAHYKSVTLRCCLLFSGLQVKMIAKDESDRFQQLCMGVQVMCHSSVPLGFCWLMVATNRSMARLSRSAGASVLVSVSSGSSSFAAPTKSRYHS